MNRYTHLAEIYGIRCYFNEYTYEIKGTNWIRDKVINFFIWFDSIGTAGLFHPEGLEIKLIKELKT